MDLTCWITSLLFSDVLEKILVSGSNFTVAIICSITANDMVAIHTQANGKWLGNLLVIWLNFFFGVSNLKYYKSKLSNWNGLCRENNINIYLKHERFFNLWILKQLVLEGYRLLLFSELKKETWNEIQNSVHLFCELKTEDTFPCKIWRPITGRLINCIVKVSIASI